MGSNRDGHLQGATGEDKAPTRGGRIGGRLVTVGLLVAVIFAFGLVGTGAVSMRHQGATFFDYLPDWPFWAGVLLVAAAAIGLLAFMRRKGFASPRTTVGAVIAVIAAIPVGLLANAEFVTRLDDLTHKRFLFWATLISAGLALVAAWVTFASDDDLADRDAEVEQLREDLAKATAGLAEKDATISQLGLGIAAVAVFASPARLEGERWAAPTEVLERDSREPASVQG